MALRDLTTSSKQLSEQQIEELVAPFVRYDPEAGVIVLLPAASRLSTRQRVLVYVAALQGWPFVTDKPLPTTASPAQISSALHIPGGTLRPILKELKEAHFVRAAGSEYSVVAAALEGVRTELGAKKPLTATSPSRRGRSATPVDAKEPAGQPWAGRKGKRHGGESGAFVGWVQDGFFRQPKTFREVLDRFHGAGRMIKSTSLPGYLLEAVRAGVLTRAKKEIDGKRVWVYQAPPRDGGIEH